MQPYNILPKIIPDLVWDKSLPFPLNNTWGYHDAATGNGRWDLYYNEMVKRYGEPESIERFCDKMQLMNAVGYQGIFEAAGHKLNDIGGVMLWKLNAAFPSVVWQVYDWFLMPNAGYYFMQNACEPVHIQLNIISNMVTVLNRTYHKASGLIAKAEVYDIDSKRIFSENMDVNLGPVEVKETFSLDRIIKEAKGVSFVVLNLRNRSGEEVSHNVYWISPDGGFNTLNQLAETNISVSLLNEEKGKIEHRWKMRITNPSSKIAFFIRPQLISQGEEVLPSFWSKGYFTLAPGESTEITVICPAAKLKGSDPAWRVSGWNVPVTEVALNSR